MNAFLRLLQRRVAVSEGFKVGADGKMLGLTFISRQTETKAIVC
jgi:hypothetical protein